MSNTSGPEEDKNMHNLFQCKSSLVSNNGQTLNTFRGQTGSLHCDHLELSCEGHMKECEVDGEPLLPTVADRLHWSSG